MQQGISVSSAAKASPRHYRLRSKIALLFATLTLCALAAEGALRIFYPSDRLEYVADDELLWRYKPDQVGWVPLADGGRSPMATIDEHGFRRSSRAADAGAVRVLTLGDSDTFGSGVADEETFSAQLEQLSGGRLAVTNAGVGGYGIFQEEIVLRRVIGMVQPKYIVVTIPDFELYRQPFPSEEEKRAFLRAGNLRNAVRRYSRLVTVVARIFERLHLVSSGRAVPNALPVNQAEEASTDRSLPTETYRRCWEKDRARLLAMKQLADQHGAQLVLVAWPNGHRNTPFFLASLASLAEEQRLTLVNLGGTLAAHQGDGLYLFPRDPHPSPRGHQVVAQEIYRVVFANAFPEFKL